MGFDCGTCREPLKIKLTKALVIEQISGAQSRADELLFSLAAEVQAVVFGS